MAAYKIVVDERIEGREGQTLEGTGVNEADYFDGIDEANTKALAQDLGRQWMAQVSLPADRHRIASNCLDSIREGYMPTHQDLAWAAEEVGRRLTEDEERGLVREMKDYFENESTGGEF